jgi:hygromycin-B 7''-O-kinase
MAIQEYSKRLGVISPEQFQLALERLHLGDFVRAEPIPFGLFGQNVYLTSTSGEYVLRGVPHYPWQFPRERFFAEQLHERTRAPVPYPYLLELSTDIFGWSFAVMPRLPGLQMQDPDVAARLSGEDRLAIARALARMLAEVQELTWEQAGSYDHEAGRVEPFAEPYREHVVSNIREKVADARACNGRTTDEDVRWVEGIVARAEPWFHAPFTPCVVHADYGEHNTVLSRTGEGWQVSGVFDLMTAHFGDGNWDLSGPVLGYLKRDRALADAYVDEYLRLRPPSVGFVALQRLYMVDLQLSLWRYWQRHESGMPADMADARGFEEWARAGVEYWSRLSG